eukprot:scaffold145417_cov19-Tisochrysis_lutea.AAC.1
MQQAPHLSCWVAARSSSVPLGYSMHLISPIPIPSPTPQSRAPVPLECITHLISPTGLLQGLRQSHRDAARTSSAAPGSQIQSPKNAGWQLLAGSAGARALGWQALP